MSNSYFQFKQFKIEQDRCAMKVSTDACIQGAWTPVTSEIKTVLDIGAGTGLLSLMIAQRNQQAIIDALEIDAAAAKQARQNFEQSPWKKRMNVIEADARQFAFNKKFNIVICNPPFFINSLLSDKLQKNLARHTLSLSFEELFVVIKNNLSPNGYASILLPAAEHKLWEELLARHNWKIFHQLNIIPRINQKANRIVSLCSADLLRQVMIEDIIIRDSKDNYTPEFVQLLKPFYLKL